MDFLEDGVCLRADAVDTKEVHNQDMHTLYNHFLFSQEVIRNNKHETEMKRDEACIGFTNIIYINIAYCVMGKIQSTRPGTLKYLYHTRCIRGKLANRTRKGSEVNIFLFNS